MCVGKAHEVCYIQALWPLGTTDPDGGGRLSSGDAGRAQAGEGDRGGTIDLGAMTARDEEATPPLGRDTPKIALEPAPVPKAAPASRTPEPEAGCLSSAAFDIADLVKPIIHSIP